MKCIVKEKRTKVRPVTDDDIRIAQLEGRPVPKAQRPVRYENLETGEEYLCLSGGFGWPGLKPGFSLVLAVQQSEDGKNHLYKTLEEVEEKNIQVLLQHSFDLFQKYGKSCKTIPWEWYGDPENGLNEFLYEFDTHLEKEDSFYLTYPPHFKEPNKFEIYCQTIFATLQEGNKRLFLGPCKRAQSYLNQFNDEQVYKGTPEDNPAISALGYAVSALTTWKPWLRDTSVPVEDEEENFEQIFLREANFFHQTDLP